MCIASMCWARLPFLFFCFHINPMGLKTTTTATTPTKNISLWGCFLEDCVSRTVLWLKKCILIIILLVCVYSVMFLQWYMVTVVHAYNRFHSSEIRCFVNGKVVSTGETTLVHANEVNQPTKSFEIALL